MVNILAVVGSSQESRHFSDERFNSLGWLDSIKSIYHLSDYKGKMYGLDGFGKKSVDKLLESIEKAEKLHLTDLFMHSPYL